MELEGMSLLYSRSAAVRLDLDRARQGGRGGREPGYVLTERKLK